MSDIDNERVLLVRKHIAMPYDKDDFERLQCAFMDLDSLLFKYQKLGVKEIVDIIFPIVKSLEPIVAALALKEIYRDELVKRH